MTIPNRGFTLIELLIALAIFSFLLMLAGPMYARFMGNSQIRNAGDGMLNDPSERVLNEPFVLSGLLIFATYVPKQLSSVGNNNAVCADTGDTHVFLLNINNGNAISTLVGAEGTGSPTGTSNRYFVLSKDLGLNVSSAESTPIVVTKGGQTPPAEPPLSAAVKDVMAQIMKQMPPACRFTNKRISINVTDTFNTTYNVGAIPVCIIEKNWKEF